MNTNGQYPWGYDHTQSMQKYTPRDDYTQAIPTYTPVHDRATQPRTRHTAPKRKTLTRDQKAITAILGLCLLIVGIGAAALTLVPKNAANTVQEVAGAPAASSIAAQLGCGGFHDLGPSEAGGVIDSGYCYRGGVKYAIDTFASQDARDAWLQEAEPLGVNPKWETDYSVTYKSVGK